MIFEFPSQWKVSKFDDWSFYRQHFQKCAESKAVDILAIEPNKTCLWLIEIKDYRQYRRTKAAELPDEIAIKVRDTLAALVAAKVNANNPTEKSFAKAALSCCQLKIVLHLEQPAKPSKLFPKPFNPPHVRQRLKQLIKAIDAHPKVLARTRMAQVDWRVKEK
ncbi:MAG: hypothetical protein SVR94_05080 [Pseudomonadota bacterium]|nr:hypothetical protein [Pseudomonadota bacterium]